MVHKTRGGDTRATPKLEGDNWQPVLLGLGLRGLGFRVKGFRVKGFRV